MLVRRLVNHPVYLRVRFVENKDIIIIIINLLTGVAAGPGGSGGNSSLSTQSCGNSACAGSRLCPVIFPFSLSPFPLASISSSSSPSSSSASSRNLAALLSGRRGGVSKDRGRFTGTRRYFGCSFGVREMSGGSFSSETSHRPLIFSWSAVRRRD